METNSVRQDVVGFLMQRSAASLQARLRDTTKPLAKPRWCVDDSEYAASARYFDPINDRNLFAGSPARSGLVAGAKDRSRQSDAAFSGQIACRRSRPFSHALNNLGRVGAESRTSIISGARSRALQDADRNRDGAPTNVCAASTRLTANRPRSLQAFANWNFPLWLRRARADTAILYRRPNIAAAIASSRYARP